MNDCCHEEHNIPQKKKFDWLLWICLGLVVSSYVLHYSQIQMSKQTMEFTHASVELMGKMWLGIFVGAFFVGILDFVPQEMVTATLGGKSGVKGILKATFAGLLLDLCSHGILLVGMKVYKRGATLGQTMAFLIASPWNSLSLTIILFALIGFKWTVLFILLSGVLAVISGVIFDQLVERKILPDNPSTVDLPIDYNVKKQLKMLIGQVKWLDVRGYFSLLYSGIKGSKSILKWLFLGVVVAAVVRAFVPLEIFQTYLGPTGLGLFFTLIFATIIEVCSEGSTPIAADIFTRAGAPGNSFAFLMTGVSTDYTEIMSIKETMRSWKIALFLPLVTVPQVIFVSWILNQFS